jgi:hypothetical protein
MDKSLAALWVNPRAFEPALRQKAAVAQGAEAVALKTLLVYWQALEGIAVSVALQKDLALSLAVRAKVEKLPPAARRFFRTAAERSDLWDRFPQNTILAAAGRVDVAAWFEILSTFVTKETRQSFCNMVDTSVGAIVGKEVIREVLPQLGPDWGFCVVTPSVKDKRWVPDLIGALRIRAERTENPADLVVVNALNSLATLAAFHHNRIRPGSLSLKFVVQDNVEVKYLVSEDHFPLGFQPAFALKDGYVVVASSPEALRRFQTVPATIPPQPSTRDIPLMRLSLSELRNFLKDRSELLAERLAQKDNIAKEEANRRLSDLLAGLQLFDRVELSQRAGPGQVLLTLRIQMVQPLK